MDNKQIIEKANEILNGEIKALDIHNVNPTLGHHYTIGPKHVAFAADHFCGMLGEAAIESFEKRGGHCAHPGCRASYGEHLSDKVMFLQLTKNMPQAEAQKLLVAIKPVLDENDIAGITFVDTDEKFRIN